jgi:hypothetical protein
MKNIVICLLLLISCSIKIYGLEIFSSPFPSPEELRPRSAGKNSPVARMEEEMRFLEAGETIGDEDIEIQSIASLVVAFMGSCTEKK